MYAVQQGYLNVINLQEKYKKEGCDEQFRFLSNVRQRKNLPTYILTILRHDTFDVAKHFQVNGIYLNLSNRDGEWKFLDLSPQTDCCIYFISCGGFREHKT